MDVVIKLIRSLLITSPDGLLIAEINRMYKEDMGEPVPFRQHGFENLSDFLRSSGQFVAKKTDTGLRVMAKVTDASAHIVEMRRKQSVSQAERKRKKRLATGSASKFGAIRPQFRSNVSKMTPRPRPRISNSSHFSTVSRNTMKPTHYGNNTTASAIVQQVASEPTKSTDFSKQTERLAKEPVRLTENSADYSAKNADRSKNAEIASNNDTKNIYVSKPQKVNLYARLATKFDSSSEKPERASIITKSQPINGHIETSGTELPLERPRRTVKHVRFATMQGPSNPLKPSEPLEIMDEKPPLVPYVSPPRTPPLRSLTPPTTPLRSSTPPTTPPLDKLPKPDLNARLSPKQPIESNKFDEPKCVKRISRAVLVKMFQELQQQQKNSQECEKSTLDSHVDSSKDDASQNGVIKTVQMKSDLPSRLRPKRIIYTSEVELITQKVNN